MSLRFTVLASGSSGNATLIETDRGGALIDAGLGIRQLAARLAKVGRSWASVQALLLTHPHTDHWNDATLGQLFSRRVAVWCHPSHHLYFESSSRYFPLLKVAGLIHDYEPDSTFSPIPGLRCRPLALSHDGGPTFGFRLEGSGDLFGESAALGYVADLGTWDETLVESLADVDLLALEFNHDVELECRSGRSAALISRVLGDNGHLSNEQAATMLAAVLRRSSPGRLRHVVQLHLSRDCNRPALAADAARAVLAALEAAVELHTAEQDRPGAPIQLGADAIRRRMSRHTRRRRRFAPQPGAFLPGFEDLALPEGVGLATTVAMTNDEIQLAKE